MDAPNGCSFDDLGKETDAQTQQNIGAFAIVGGAGFLVLGAVLVLTAPSEPATRVVPVASRTGAGLSLTRSF